MLRYTYKDKNTPIHRLNPFAKLAWILSVFILAIQFNHIYYLLALFLITLVPIIVARVWGEWLSLMKFMLFLSGLVVIITVLVNWNGEHILYQASFQVPLMGRPQITVEAIVWGITNAIRLLAIVSAFSLFILTIHPDDLMAGMVKLRLPYNLVLVNSLSTRFVPTLFEDISRISDAQRSRGLETDRGNIFQKVRGYSAVIIPLLANSLDRAIQVAEAMESRAFGSAKRRTFYKEMRVSKFDIVSIIATLFPSILGITMWCLQDFGRCQFSPWEGAGLPESPLFTAIICSLLLIVLLAFIKRRIELDQV
jgi:energy-coupling factor transport system permease protein